MSSCEAALTGLVVGPEKSSSVGPVTRMLAPGSASASAAGSSCGRDMLQAPTPRRFSANLPSDQ
jgi:hypothetical protein